MKHLALALLLLPFWWPFGHKSTSRTYQSKSKGGGHGKPQPPPPPPPPPAAPLLAFVSRQIPPDGSIYWSVPKDLLGIGPHSRFRVDPPGKLEILMSDNSVKTLPLGTISDVSSPDVSYDGSRIVFAGFNSPFDPSMNQPDGNPNGWRIWTINVDGTNLKQVTFSDQSLDVSQFASAGPSLAAYDDTFPCWLPDGRIVFSSTRWPEFAQYSGVRATNLYVVNPDGSNLHRITSERNGADMPTVDPQTGKIIYSRWWRNQRFAINDMTTVADPNGGYVQKDGLSADRNNEACGPDCLWRNQWHLAAINPDGTDLKMWGGPHHKLDASHAYGGRVVSDGRFLANYFPMPNMSEASGFGGLRFFTRGTEDESGYLGITYLTLDYVNPSNPTSYGIFNGAYATEAAQLPDGRIVFSRASDVGQDYGLYVTAGPSSTSAALLYDNPGTAELNPVAISTRPLAPVITDKVTKTAPLLPPVAAGRYGSGGTFVFSDANVYFNDKVDGLDTSAPAVGSAARIRFFLDQQRTSPGSFPNLDWPILLAELPVNQDGSAVNPSAPADVPLFEQLRTATGTVPPTPGNPGGAAHVAGMNFGRPGDTVRCVGCHAGHSMIPFPADPEFTNLAPGALVSVSSSRDHNKDGGLIDRRVLKGQVSDYWSSAAGEVTGQWVQLSFPVPVTVRAVVLYNPRMDPSSSVQIASAAVTLSSGQSAVTAGPLSVSGTSVAFADVAGVNWVRVDLGASSGTFFGMSAVALAEVEVIASAR